MDQASYQALVASLEADARRDPDGMRRRVFALIALGYGYVFGVLGVILAAIVLVIALAVSTKNIALTWKLLAALFVVAGFILKALWVRATPPEGVRLRPGQAPMLEQRVEEIRAALRAPRPSEIVLTEEFNASVMQIPQLGVFGFPRTYLVLGLPLMYALTPAQFDAVLAHEFGHLSGSHPKRGLWVYRMFRTWHQLMTQMEQSKSWASGLFDRFVHWYVPRLNAYGFVMSRADEYAADADAARVTSAAAIGGALVALELRGRVYERTVWSTVWARADHEPDPPEQSWRAVPQMLREGDAHPERRDWLGAALLARASENDTHPSLHERLHALSLVPPDAKAAVPTAEQLLTSAPLERAAAEHYLPEVAAERLVALDRSWRTEVAAKWRARFQEVQAKRARLTELRASGAASELTEAERLLETGALLSELDGDEAAIAPLEQGIALGPAPAWAHFILGRGLLARGDDAGEPHIKQAIDLDFDAAQPGVSLLYRYFEKAGRTDAMEQILAWYEQRAQANQESHHERNSLERTDRFVAPELTDADRRVVHAAVRETPGVKSVVVARKVTRHYPEHPMLVVLVERRLGAILRSGRYTTLVEDLLKRLKLETPAYVLVQLETGDMAWLRAAMRRSDAAVEFTRDGRDRVLGTG